jgi:hypothetical protein
MREGEEELAEEWIGVGEKEEQEKEAHFQRRIE